MEDRLPSDAEPAASAGEELKLSVPTVTASLKHLAKFGIARKPPGAITAAFTRTTNT